MWCWFLVYNNILGVTWFLCWILQFLEPVGIHFGARWRVMDTVQTLCSVMGNMLDMSLLPKMWVVFMHSVNQSWVERVESWDNLNLQCLLNLIQHKPLSVENYWLLQARFVCCYFYLGGVPAEEGRERKKSPDVRVVRTCIVGAAAFSHCSKHNICYVIQ